LNCTACICPFRSWRNIACLCTLATIRKALWTQNDDLFPPLAENKKISFAVEGITQELLVTGDLPRVQRALANLVDNAIKFTPAGGRVAITASQDHTGVKAGLFFIMPPFLAFVSD